ncbi:MAG: hypothetical protein LBR23_06950 [Spirochaetaceae bacterium]|jgi:hypothetical protein|nr:hypothetical protein [Spirochaetaceae bacterium]
MRNRKILFGFAVCLLAAVVLAGCDNKGALEGVWKATDNGETVRIAFVGDKLLYEGEGFYSYTYEKNVGTAKGEYDSATFTVKGSSLTFDRDREAIVFTKDKDSKTPDEIRGLWTAKIDGNKYYVAFINGLVFIAEDYDTEIYPYAFDKGKVTIGDGEVNFTVSGNTLTSGGLWGEASFTRVTAEKKSAAAGSKALIGTWEEDDYGFTWSFTKTTFIQEVMGIKTSVPYKVKGNAIVTEYEGASVEMDYELDGDTLAVEVMGLSLEFTRVGK